PEATLRTRFPTTEKTPPRTPLRDIKWRNQFHRFTRTPIDDAKVVDRSARRTGAGRALASAGGSGCKRTELRSAERSATLLGDSPNDLTGAEDGAFDTGSFVVPRLAFRWA